METKVHRMARVFTMYTMLKTLFCVLQFSSYLYLIMWVVSPAPVTMGHCYLERVGKSVKYRDSKGYGGEETKEN